VHKARRNWATLQHKEAALARRQTQQQTQTRTCRSRRSKAAAGTQGAAASPVARLRRRPPAAAAAAAAARSLRCAWRAPWLPPSCPPRLHVETRCQTTDIRTSLQPPQLHDSGIVLRPNLWLLLIRPLQLC